ncbi:uncharacterized protein [Amphiura filiformis]|uniref:uncharacterized protein n=1 Tax=Amphiura filiformis TaxID=82378 RepID=UPI003B20F3BE
MAITTSPSSNFTTVTQTDGTSNSFSIDALHIVLLVLLFACILLIILFFVRIQILRRQLMAPFEVRRQWWRFFRKDEATQVTDREIIEETKCLIGGMEGDVVKEDVKSDQAMPTQVNPLEDKGSRTTSTSSSNGQDGSQTPDSEVKHSPLEIPTRKQPNVVPVTNNFYIGYVPEAQLSPNPAAVVFLSRPSRLDTGRNHTKTTQEESDIKTMKDPYTI